MNNNLWEQGRLYSLYINAPCVPLKSHQTIHITLSPKLVDKNVR